jgi:hypothetical protein
MGSRRGRRGAWTADDTYLARVLPSLDRNNPVAVSETVALPDALFQRMAARYATLPAGSPAWHLLVGGSQRERLIDAATTSY